MVISPCWLSFSYSLLGCVPCLRGLLSFILLCKVVRFLFCLANHLVFNSRKALNWLHNGFKLFCIKFIYYISYVKIINIFFIEIVFFVKLKKIFSTSVENDKEMFNICQGGDLIISNLSLSFFKREAFL